MSPTRLSEYVRCGRCRGARTPTGRAAWSLATPVIRDGRLQVGEPGSPVREFAEADYCYGVGPLTMRVHRIGWNTPVPHEGDTWFEVEGTVIGRSGQDGERRQVLVRAQRLPEPPPPRKRPRLRP